MGDDDAVNSGIIGEFLQASRDPVPVLRGRSPTGTLRSPQESPQVLGRQPGDESQIGQVAGPGLRSDALGVRLAAGKLEAGVAVPGDLAAHGDQHDVRQIEARRRQRWYFLSARSGRRQERRDSPGDAEHSPPPLRDPPARLGSLSTH